MPSEEAAYMEWFNANPGERNNTWLAWQAARRTPPAQAGAGVVEALRGMLEFAAEMNANQGDRERDDPRVTAAGDALSAAPHPAGADNGGKTGWPPGLLQDDSRGLAQWLASRPDARRRVREALDAAPTPPQPAAQPGEEALEKALRYDVDEIRRIANAVRVQNGPTDPATPQQYVYAGWAACAAAARAAQPATQKEMP